MPLRSLRDGEHIGRDDVDQIRHYIRMLANNIERDGLAQPLFVHNFSRGQQSIFVGKSRYQALSALKWTHAPALVAGPIAEWSEPIEGRLISTVEEAQQLLKGGEVGILNGNLIVLFSPRLEYLKGWTKSGPFYQRNSKDDA